MTATESPMRHPEGIDWNEELRRHDGWLRVVIAARSGEPQAVDEIWQEVALAAVRQRAPVRDPRRVAPWLYQLAVRQALMYRRRCGRQRNLRQRYAQQQLGQAASERSHAPDPLDWLLAVERRELVRRALQRLPPRDAEMLTLKYTQNWSYHQLADHLGMTHAAVESRLHRARQKLRNELAKLDVVEANL